MVSQSSWTLSNSSLSIFVRHSFIAILEFRWKTYNRKGNGQAQGLPNRDREPLILCTSAVWSSKFDVVSPWGKISFADDSKNFELKLALTKIRKMNNTGFWRETLRPSRSNDSILRYYDLMMSSWLKKGFQKYMVIFYLGWAALLGNMYLNRWSNSFNVFYLWNESISGFKYTITRRRSTMHPNSSVYKILFINNPKTAWLF